MKRIITYFVLAALTTVGAIADDGGFKLENAYIKAHVSKDNVWDITEVLTVNFLEPRHGIYKYVPSKFIYSFPDASGKMVPYEYTNYIYDCNVYGYEFTTEVDSGDAKNTIFKIGSGDKRVMGEQKYVIKYKIRYFDDRYEGEDFLCHTIWGNGWNTPVDTLLFHVEFEKTLPASIKQSLNTYSGELGTTSNADSVYVYYRQEDNSICGRVLDLPANHAVTISSQLPQGYWEIQPKDLTLFYIFAGLAALFAIVTVARLVLVKNHTSIRVLSFYPPKGMSSAEVGTVFDNETGYDDLASLVPWMASKGYIHIVENTDENGAKIKDDLTLVKAKELPENAPEYQKTFMKAVFGIKETVRLKSLSLTFNESYNLRRQIENIFTGERELLFKNDKAIWSWILMLLCMLGAASTCNLTCGFSATFFFMELLTMVGVLFWMGRRRIKKSLEYRRYSIFKSILSVIKWTLGLLFAICVNVNSLDDGFLAIPFEYIVCGSVVAALVTYFLRYAVVNTQYRARVMGELNGLRDFIKTAELPRLKMLVDENPQYFYDVLPYAMVFGLTDKWVKLFESIEMENPEWYVGSGPINVGYMPLLMNNISTRVSGSINASIRKSIASSGSGYSHSSSGGGYSGGGRSFSGGGGGGGGGGSW